MLKVQTWEQAKPGRKAFKKDTFEGSITDIIGTHTLRHPGAQAFFVEQDPNWVTPSHFHLEHQFQVIMAGSGSIGSHGVARLNVHYAAPETAYGPITAGPEGVSYLTMRMSGDTSAWYIHKPGSLERLKSGVRQKREQTYGSPSDALGTGGAGELHQLKEPSVDNIIKPRADGLAAHFVRLPPGSSQQLPTENLYGGRYYVVTSGSVKLNNADAQTMTVAFGSHDEDLLMRAGHEGAEILVLQFPVQARSGIEA